MNQKGFASIILIAIVLVAVGVAGYFFLNKNSEMPLLLENHVSDKNQVEPLAAVSSLAGFTAEVTGVRTAAISGPGIFFCIPSSVRSSPGMNAPSLLVLADAQSTHENGITFSIPIHTPSGTYKLTANPSPFPDAVEFQVRAQIGSAVDYFNKETNGTLTIDSIPEGTSTSKKFPLKGSFEFETSNSKKEQIKVKGSFDFPAPTDDSKYCH